MKRQSITNEELAQLAARNLKRVTDAKAAMGTRLCTHPSNSPVRSDNPRVLQVSRQLTFLGLHPRQQSYLGTER